jgi:hypothetical protein
MKDLKIYAIQGPDGAVWKTPKGKWNWGSAGAAKNAWSCHNNWRGYVDGVWTVQEPKLEEQGYRVVKIGDFVWVPV